ncbi:MAG TPA: hypothetical protein VKU36_04400 [Candidatus Babeliales bacterium]|nr:hypothetical protein [Candidatus Babeliales bacterium]
MNSTLYLRYALLIIAGLSFQLQGMELWKNTRRNIMRALWPTHTEVFANDTQQVILNTDEKVTKTIKTSGLIGCTATVTYARDINQNQMIVFTHYAPSHHQEHMQNLKYQLQTITQRTKIDHATSIFILPHSDDKKSHFLNYHDYDTHSVHCQDKLCNNPGCTLKNIIKDELHDHSIQIQHVDYQLAPLGKAYFDTDVMVTLSHEVPSYCKISELCLINKTLKFE